MQNLNVLLQLQHVFSTGNRLARTATQLKLCKQDGLKKKNALVDSLTISYSCNGYVFYQSKLCRQQSINAPNNTLLLKYDLRKYQNVKMAHQTGRGQGMASIMELFLQYH